MSEHEHEWSMAWDYCGSHSYVCRVCSVTLDDAEAEARVNGYPAALQQNAELRKRDESLADDLRHEANYIDMAPLDTLGKRNTTVARLRRIADALASQEKPG